MRSVLLAVDGIVLDIGNDALVLNGLQFLPNDFPARSGSSPWYSKLRPLRGSRMMSLPPPSETLKPWSRVSRPMTAPNSYASFGSQVAVSASDAGSAVAMPSCAFAEVGDANPRADQIEVWDSQARNSRDKAVAPECSWDFRAKHRHASVDKLNFLIQRHLLHDQVGSLVG